MDNTAIKQIQTSSNIDKMIKNLDERGTKSTVFLKHQDFEVMDLEQFMEFRDSYRFNFNTISLADFVQYVKDHDSNEGACFIDPRSMTAENVFDLGAIDSPLHQRHTASLTLEKTASYLAILSHCGNKLTQNQAAEFFEDWSENLETFSTSGAMEAKAAASSMRQMTIETARELSSSVGDYSESMSAMEKIEVKGKASKPVEFSFECAPYLHLSVQKINVRISVDLQGEKPRFIFKIVKHDELREKIANDFKMILTEKLKSSLKTYLGTR